MDAIKEAMIRYEDQNGPSYTAGEQLNGAMIFGTADELIAAISGPPQHDAHLRPWHWRNYCIHTYGFTPDYSRRAS